ncbi:hypothetical protein BJ875DRAFT_465113 [Amylocarpus encephaloides]|uniref:Chitin synthase activator n=1 Tax=Amylocarpus encephaloides TaxID=45428 RepID=A0A9P7YFR0_9HELO|nr:hypothetical protein BJ875DRAFT_465113 [Amylocarpus encephaloides]
MAYQNSSYAYNQRKTEGASGAREYHQPSRVPLPQTGYIDSMSDNYTRPPRLSATFIPGREDDFCSPEIVSPAPQRIMPEVPSNMQEQLSHLELEARNPPTHRMSIASTASGMQSPPFLDQHRIQNHYPSQQLARGPGFNASYEHTNASAYQNIDRDYSRTGGVRPDPESPKFSPFPKPLNPGPNVPLSDEDKEEVLERARSLVLKSTDPEMQLAWAQDALSWVEVASQFANRLQSEGQPARPITPKVEHSLRVDALSIVGFLADQHHPKAEFMKSMWLEFGKFGHRIDKKEAFMGYKRAAEKGYARAEYRMGMQFESSNNSVKAIDHYNRGVGMGDSAAHYRLGMMTLLGQHGMSLDYPQGVELIRYSADTADENAPQGAYVYGMLLAHELPNISVPEQFLPFDLNEAKLFIEKAAYLGFSKAQLKMAQAYELCQLGCEFEPSLSLHYNALAARQGESEADMAISKWFLCGYESLFEKNEELAFTYAKRAAGAKMATAEFAMGYFYEIGMYVAVDLEESASWYKRASEHGNKDALGRIDSIRKNSALSKSDHEQVAISRIKSMHGSQRGVRPDRFKQRGAPMTPIADEAMDMPDPRNTYDGFSGQLRGQNPPPPKPKVAAPYPEDDVAHLPGGYANGPNGPFNGQGLRPHSSVHEGPLADRPASTFGILPPQHGNNGITSAGPLRPSSSMGNMHIPAGRGHDPAGRAGVVSSGWEPQVPPPHRQPSQHPPQTHGILPPVDIGPPMNFDQGHGRGKPPPLNTSKPQPPRPQGYPHDSRQSSGPQGYNSRPDPSAARREPPSANRPPRGASMMSPSPITSPQSSGGYGGMQSPSFQQNPNRASGPSQRPPPGHTMASQRQPSSHTVASQDSRPPSAAPSTAPSTAPSVASTAPKKPVKAGPATFEQMGIPVAKKEEDCCVM